MSKKGLGVAHPVRISDAAVQWLAHGERGLSSETIFTHLTSVDALRDWGASHPHDPADFRRCLLLLEQCPEFKERFPEMATVSKEWKRLVRAWDELTALFEQECPEWRNPPRGSRSTKTYDRMKEVIDGKK